MVVRLALFMSANTKNSQMKHFPYPKSCIIHRSDIYNLQIRKKHLKNEKNSLEKLTFQNMPLPNNFQY